jgi:hypothetical protein
MVESTATARLHSGKDREASINLINTFSHLQFVLVLKQRSSFTGFNLTPNGAPFSTSQSGLKRNNKERAPFSTSLSGLQEGGLFLILQTQSGTSASFVSQINTKFQLSKMAGVIQIKDDEFAKRCLGE